MSHRTAALTLLAILTATTHSWSQDGEQRAAADAAVNPAPANPGLDATTHAQAIAALAADPALQRNPYAVLVKFRPDATNAARATALANAGATSLRRYSIVPGLELVRTTLSPEAAVATLKAAAGVAYAEVDHVVSASGDPPQNLPNDPIFAWQWGALNTGQTYTNLTGTPRADVHAPEAWWVTTGAPDFVVAIFDTGVQYTHADLAANAWVNPGEIAGNGLDDDANGYIDDVHGWDYYNDDNDPMDDSEIGHGTHVAGTVGASGNNGIGVAGMMWQCKLLPVKFLGAGGDGLISDAISGLQYVTNKGVKVSNHSWGWISPGGSSGLYDAINAARSAGHIVVASAGNDARNNDGNKANYPASYNLDNIIAVAATDPNDGLAGFSSYGLNSVDLGAPGVAVISCALTTLYGPGPYPYGIYRYLQGTSMAAPHVAGAVGLVYSRNPDWTYQQVRTQIIGTARPITSLAGRTVSGGVLDAAAALGVFVPSPPPPPAPPAAPGTPTLTSIGGGQILVAWADNSANEDGFQVQRERKSGNRWIQTTLVADVPADTTNVNDAPGAGTFRYRVLAYNSLGASSWSAWRQITN